MTYKILVAITLKEDKYTRTFTPRWRRHKYYFNTKQDLPLSHCSLSFQALHAAGLMFLCLLLYLSCGLPHESQARPACRTSLGTGSSQPRHAPRSSHLSFLCHSRHLHVTLADICVRCHATCVSHRLSPVTSTSALRSSICHYGCHLSHLCHQCHHGCHLSYFCQPPCHSYVTLAVICHTSVSHQVTYAICHHGCHLSV